MVRHQHNVPEIPIDVLRKKKCKKLLPVGQISYYGRGLTWDEKITKHRYQLEILVAEIQAIEILNSLPTDVTTPRLCQIFKAKLEIVSINRSEEGVDGFNVGSVVN